MLPVACCHTVTLISMLQRAKTVIGGTLRGGGGDLVRAPGTNGARTPGARPTALAASGAGSTSAGTPSRRQESLGAAQRRASMERVNVEDALETCQVAVAAATAAEEEKQRVVAVANKKIGKLKAANRVLQQQLADGGSALPVPPASPLPALPDLSALRCGRADAVPHAACCCLSICPASYPTVLGACMQGARARARAARRSAVAVTLGWPPRPLAEVLWRVSTAPRVAPAARQQPRLQR